MNFFAINRNALTSFVVFCLAMTALTTYVGVLIPEGHMGNPISQPNLA